MSGRTGMFIGTAVLAVKCPRRFPLALIGSSPACASSTPISHSLRTARIGSVLAARWIGLAVADAQHFMLGTASLSIFAFDPHHPDVPVIALWNAVSQEIFNTVTSHPVGGTMTTRQRALERW